MNRKQEDFMGMTTVALEVLDKHYAVLAGLPPLAAAITRARQTAADIWQAGSRQQSRLQGYTVEKDGFRSAAIGVVLRIAGLAQAWAIEHNAPVPFDQLRLGRSYMESSSAVALRQTLEDFQVSLDALDAAALLPYGVTDELRAELALTTAQFIKAMKNPGTKRNERKGVTLSLGGLLRRLRSEFRIIDRLMLAFDAQSDAVVNYRHARHIVHRGGRGAGA